MLIGDNNSHTSDQRAGTVEWAEESERCVEEAMKILMIGPLPPPIGGATKLFKYLVDDLEEDPRCKVEVIDISRPTTRNRPGWNALKAAEVLIKTLSWGRRADVISFHANQRGRVYFGPIVFAASRLLGKPLVVRAFGGVFHETFRGLSAIHRCLLLHTYLRAERCLFETRRQVRYFRRACRSNAVWYSNYTKVERYDAHDRVPAGRRRCRRFLFLGRVVPEKGVELLYEVEHRLPPGVCIDIFGPVGGSYSEEELLERGSGRVRYRGVLDDRGVAKALREHDALLLPTNCRTEGYPGVILEAFAQGMPVVVSDVQSIREIVDARCGILIEQRNPESLLTAIEQLVGDDTLYEELCRGAARRAKLFEAPARTEQFVELCQQVMVEN